MRRPEDASFRNLYQKSLAYDRRWTYRRRRAAVLAGVVAVALVLGAGVWAAATYFGFENGIRRSDALTGGKGLDQDVNILLMGLDSRLDENGKPLSQEEYDALHSGSSDDGGYNSNVLMVLHVPKDGSRATIISVPRDDYVDLAGSPDGIQQGKVKQAYGYAMDQAMREFAASPNGKSQDEIYQAARDAGRKAEISTVENFLNIRIDHFAEVTMAAFLSVAKAVAPITVCLQEATQDSYSGADFKAGVQQINAQQAVAFVRQRRDTSGSGVALSDLDRSRRQQAFISSLATQLKQKGTFTDLGRVTGILDALKDKIAVDQGLNLIDFGLKAKQLTENKTKFVTLPIVQFGTSDTGESVNIVDKQAIQAQVADLLNPKPAPASSAAAQPARPAPAAPAAGSSDGAGTQGSGAQGSGAGQDSSTGQTPAGQGSGAQGQAGQPASGQAPPAAASPSPSSTFNAGDWSDALVGGGVPCVK
ncbi:LCP family protein [Sinomonas atrocyanea]|uniref:LCP family protein n=1 Tax=Sinomonas atrocyanea TaxID=37927 RepID=UPI0027876F88|nr:LCP family protein [Sinomonas atrocyanea]MDQ0260136.1 LCP family protein required for cell wall assembly [Sinomonas atrocyanea]MDR6620198.1 LCP family protein required for cell wall assembly [Sinomonas atrocyanea]